MGGQTALNVGIELWRNEDLQRRGIRVLGTKIDAIVATEDREIFSTKLREINETLALSYPATTVEGALEAAHKIGYPVLVRAAFTLGGLGSGFAENDAELRDLAVRALEGGSSTTKQILIDQDLRGWKEVEYEARGRRPFDLLVWYHTFGPMLKKKFGRPRRRRDASEARDERAGRMRDSCHARRSSATCGIIVLRSATWRILIRWACTRATRLWSRRRRHYPIENILSFAARL